MNKFLFIACFIGVLVILTGCVSEMVMVEKSGEKYALAGESLLKRFNIQIEDYSSREVNGMLEAQVRGRNRTDSDLQFEYRYIWLDADGFEIKTQMSTWKPLNLHGRETAFMNGISPSPDAVDFQLVVRRIN